MSQPDQLPNTYMRQFFRFLGSRRALLQGTSESPASLAKIGGSNSFGDYCKFLCNARDQLEKPDIGLVLGRVNQLANMHGPVSTALFLSSDIRECLQLLLRFTPLRIPVISTRWLEEKNNIGLQIDFLRDTGDAHIPVTEALLISIANVISVISQGVVHPSRLEFNFPRPSYADAYGEAFRVSTIRFNAPHTRVLVSRRDADHRADVDPDPQLRVSAIERCEELMRGALESRSTSDRIRQLFADNPGHLWTLKDMAQHLNASRRTLQRRLRIEGAGYQQLLNSWLKEEAEQLLAERNLSIESIALLLGYSDVSNFRAACRRWFGTSPQGYRELLRRGAARRGTQRD